MGDSTLNLLLLGASVEIRLCAAAYAVGAEPQDISRAIPFVALPARRKDAGAAGGAASTAGLSVLHIWHGLDFKPGSLVDMDYFAHVRHICRHPMQFISPRFFDAPDIRISTELA